MATRPLPSEATISAIYATGQYFSHASGLSHAQADAARRLSHVERHCQVGRLLEIGPGHGEFARFAVSRGWNVTVVEPSPTLATKLRAMAGIKVIQRPFEAVAMPETFNAVVAWEVLEHVRNPDVWLQCARDAVSPNGVLALSTPNLAGLLGRVLRSRHPMICPPEHLHYFERRTLATWAETNGFRLRAVSSSSNIGTREVCRGFSRYVFGRTADVSLNSGLAAVVSPVVMLFKLADAAGLGTQLEAVLQRAS